MKPLLYSRLLSRTTTRFRSLGGLSEGGKEFTEETIVCDLSLQGAMITVKHLPQLQSELQVTMAAPGTNGEQSIQLKGYVVRIDDTSEKGRVSVSAVFTD